ncbi:MAG: NAD(P)H-hydrate dehydratase [Actinobacteria bacterium]|nr:NAD(P)H-hydrate dehydratase [Actinomycetota bacterium]
MIPIVTPAEMGAVDAAAPEPVEVLIERAGAAVARAALDLLGGAYGRRVVVLAGKGNNGNDGRAAARRLEARGVRCRVVDVGDAPGVLPDADLVVDAAFGTGFRGEVELPALARPDQPVLAVDIPSGVSGLTGEAPGTPYRAARTVTFAALKPGLLLADGAEHAGAVDIVDIGLDTSVAGAHLVEAADVARWLPDRPTASHKWRAAAWVVAGSPGMTGAAHLATRAAQRGGAGYVRLYTPGSDADPWAPTEAVVTPLAGDGWADDVLAGADRFGAIAVGPGLGTSSTAAEQVRRLVAGTTEPVVVDGDGLRALGADAHAVVAARPSGAAPVVLTPHDGEFEALAGRPPAADRFAAVRVLAEATGAVVLLKGPTTLVARPGDGHVWASTTGDARLATAGTGDVLTGLLAALLAQGLPADEAAASAAYLHGRAGALAWRRGLVAGDVVDHLPLALSELSGG